MNRTPNPSRGELRAASAGSAANGSRRAWIPDEAGQALVEQVLLLAILVGGLWIGGAWVLQVHPEMLHAVDVHMRGFYFALSMPFP